MGIGGIPYIFTKEPHSSPQTAQAHIAGGPLGVLRRRHDIHPLGGGELDFFALLDHRSLIVGRMADQAVDVGQICVGELIDRIGLGSQTGVTLSTATWLWR